MRVVSAHMVPKSGYVVNDGSTLPGMWEYNTASQRSFFSTFGEGSQIEVAEVFFQAPSAVVAGGGDAGGRGGLSDSHGQRQRRSVLIRDWKTVT